MRPPRVKGSPVRFVVICLFGILGAAGLVSAASGQEAEAPRGEPARSGIVYSVTLELEGAKGLRGTLSNAARLLAEEKPVLGSTGALRRAAQKDVPRLERALRSEGHYGGRVDFRLDRPAEGGPPVVIFQVAPGPRFEIADYRIQYTDDQPAPRHGEPEGLGVKPKGSPRGKDLARIEREVVAALRNRGYPAARAVRRYARADFSQSQAVAVFEVESGPFGTFGPIEWEGLERTDQAFLEEMVTWEDGKAFDLDALARYRDTLSGTQLFTAIDLEPAPPEADGQVPVRVSVTERKPRSVGAGLSYFTNTGGGATVFWEHRNLRGRARALRASLEIAEIEQLAALNYRQPSPRLRGTFFAGLEAGREDKDAFQSDRVTANSGFERRFGRFWSVRLAGEAEAARIEDAFAQTDSYLLSMPFRITRNSLNDPLNPTRGARLSAQLAPHGGWNDGAVGFVLASLRGSVHQDFGAEKRFVGAGWARAGTTLGPDVSEIPANKRYFAGGGGSVRAYGYQLIGPLDTDDQPFGGRAVLEGGLELRGRAVGDFWLAGFLEGGTVVLEGNPNLADGYLFGGGLGLRYATPVGPVRLDLATPFRVREGVDDRIQVYISLGQAF